MILSGQEVLVEEGEPAFRSCWECNPAHERLKSTTFLHLCFVCDRHWICGRFISPDDKPEDTIEWLKSLGLSDGDSTTKLETTKIKSEEENGGKGESNFQNT